MTQLRHDLMTHVFESEDKPILEAQQKLLGTTDLYDAHPVLLSTDSGPTHIRRAMSRLLEEEMMRTAIKDEGMAS